MRRSTTSVERGFRWVRGAVLIASAYALTVACDPPNQGSNPPSGSGARGPAGASATPGGAAAGPGASASQPGAQPGAPPPCTVELDDAPTGFFSGRLVITLPKGVELVEQNPFLARVERNDAPSSCGATLHFAALGYMRPAGTRQENRDQLLNFRGIPAEEITGWEQEGDDGSTYTGVYNASAAANGAPPVKGLVWMRRVGQVSFYVIYEAEPASWPQIEASLRASLADIKTRE